MRKTSKRKSASKAEKKEVFYVSVQDPIELQRSLLESSKEMLQMLARYEKFKEVRKEKHETIFSLKAEIADLQKMVNKLKVLLPETHLRIALKQERARMSKAKEKKGKESQKKVQKGKVVLKTAAVEVVAKEEHLSRTELSELNKLEAELADIESKLGTLV